MTLRSCVPAALVAGLTLLTIAENLASATTAPGPDAFGYTVQATSLFSFLQITNAGVARVLWFDDDTSFTASIGFSFSFYGTNYSTVSFNPNGLMTFGTPSSDYVNVDLTMSSPTNDAPTIAVLWDDWETQENWADGVYYKTTGNPGSRQFIVQWNKVVPVNGDGTNTVTFEVRLFEASNKILFSYFDTVVSDESTPVASLGVGATVAIRDVNGQSNGRNLEWSFNQAVITNGLNILFTLPNRSPIAVNDAAATSEDTPATINVLANDSDPDGEPFTLISFTQGVHGTITTNGNGTITYLPATNFFGSDQFTYTISDGQASATGLVSVTVFPVNHPPTLDALSDLVINEDAGTQMVNLTGIGSGAANEDDNLTVTASSSNPALIVAPVVGYTSPNATGSLSFILVSNAFGIAMITVTVNDGQPSNNISSRSFNVTVNQANHPPTARPDAADTYQDLTLRLTSESLLANDSDVDPGDNLLITDVSPASSAGGSVALDGFFNETVSYTPPAGFIGSDTFTYTVSDEQGGTATGTVIIAVWPSLKIKSFEQQSGSRFIIWFDAIPGRRYAIEGSLDLSNWNSLGMASEVSSGQFQFEDSGTDGLAMRFYRLHEI